MEEQVKEGTKIEPQVLSEERDTLLRSQPSYKQKEYWNERYKVKETYYDWYCGYNELKPVFEKCYNLKKDAKILMIGCGNSKLSEEMYDDGFTNIISTDISDVVIEQLKKDTQQKKKNLIFEVEDCTSLSYADQTFDIVFDKGTLDAISCDLDGESVAKMIKEMMRVCKYDGSVVIVSFGQLHERRSVFKESLGFERYTYELCKKYLSIDSQLTNIMRHISNGLPMNLVLKDKKLLVQTLIEMKKIKNSLNNEVIKSVEIDWDNLMTIDETKESEGEQEEEKKVEQSNEKQQQKQGEVVEIQQANEQQQPTDLSNAPKQLSQQQKEEQQNNIQDINENIHTQNTSATTQIEEQKLQNTKAPENEVKQEKSGDNDNEEEESDDEDDDEEEEENSDEEQQKSKFRRQAQCFIYRISLKN